MIRALTIFWAKPTILLAIHKESRKRGTVFQGTQCHAFGIFWRRQPSFAQSAKMPASCAWQASLPIFGRGKRTGFDAKCASRGKCCKKVKAITWGGRAEPSPIRVVATKKKASKWMLSFFGGATRNRFGDKGFADLCLTAWLWRNCFIYQVFLIAFLLPNAPETNFSL